MKKPDPLQYFSYQHLPVGSLMYETSKTVHDVAVKMLELPECAERSAGLRKLLEAKDCFVRAAIPVRMKD